MLQSLIEFIEKNNGINNKKQLSDLVIQEFSCVKDRSVFYTDFFAIRFSQAKTSNLGNTILSLSALQKYDHLPFIVCVVTPSKNYLFLSNTTFLSKISHSSQQLRVDNIKGSFNGTDIIREVDNIKNSPENFPLLVSLTKIIFFRKI